MVRSDLSSEQGQPEQGAEGCVWMGFEHLLGLGLLNSSGQPAPALFTLL